MAPFYPHAGFGGHAWIFRPILEDAVLQCPVDFNQGQLLEGVKEILLGNLSSYPTLVDLPDLILWDMKLWAEDEIPQDFDPENLPTELPEGENQSFQCFIPFSTGLQGQYFVSVAVKNIVVILD